MTLGRVALFLFGCGLAIYGYVGYLKKTVYKQRMQKATAHLSQMTVEKSVLSMSPEEDIPVLRTQKKLAPAHPLGNREKEAMQKIKLRFNVGDFVTAVELADQFSDDRSLAPAFHAWLKEQMPPLLLSAGWTLLNTAKCQEATRYFMRAQAMTKSHELSKGLGFCQYKLGEYLAAKENLQFYLTQQPGDSQIRLLYTDVLESLRLYDEAMTTLDEGIALDGTKSELEKRRESMVARQEEGSEQVTERHGRFVISYRPNDHGEVVNRVFEILDVALSEYVNEFGMRLPETDIEVVLYPEDRFQAVVVDGPDWAEGIFDGRLRIPIPVEGEVNDRKLTLTLRHELVHALFSQMSDERPLPPWFEEGFAQRLACGREGCARTAKSLKKGDFLPAEDFSQPYTAYAAVKAGRIYRQSLFLIEVLEEYLRQRADRLSAVISGVSKSGSLDSDAVLKRTEMTFANLYSLAEGKWNE